MNIFSIHVCTPKLPISSVKCDQCDYEAPNVESMVSHLLSAHGKEIHFEKCTFCEYESSSRQLLSDHIVTKHATILHILAEQQSPLMMELNSFKNEVSSLLNVVMGDQIEFKKQLMNMSIGRNDQIRLVDE